jgi:exopolysaccharide biosynthesis protein
MYFKPQPKPKQEALFEGVEYIRDVRSSPRDIVIHMVKIDLQEAGIRTLVTPGNPDEELPLKARTTSEFLNDYGLQVAINGDGFTPWHSNMFLDYYPHSGDRVDSIGFAASKGVRYSEDTNKEPTLYLSANNKARFDIQIGKIHNAISGNEMLIRNGRTVTGLDNGQPGPRTAVALDRSYRHLFLVVVDGRQPGFSDGVTLYELTEIILFHGGYHAMNLDGGGSSTLVVEGKPGNSNVLNSPIHNSIPGRQRPVGNHLGIYAKPLKSK